MKLKQFMFALVAMLLGFAMSSSAQTSVVSTLDELKAALGNSTDIVVVGDITVDETVVVSEGTTVSVGTMVYVVSTENPYPGVTYNKTATKSGKISGNTFSVGFQISLDGGETWFTDTTNGKAQAVTVKTDGTKSISTSFQSAFTNAKCGEVVHMLKDAHVQSTNSKKNNGPLRSYYGLILEGNGHTIYTDLESSGASNEYATIKFTSYLAGTGADVRPVLKNVTINSQNNAKADIDLVSGDVTFTVSLYNVNLLGNCQYASFPIKTKSIIINKSNVKLYDSNIPSWDAGSANAIEFYSGEYSLSFNTKCKVYGGTFHNNNSGNATIMSAGTSEVTINGGTISIKDGRVPGNGNTWTSCLTDAANTAKIIVNGGTFNGGVRVQGGATMTINGGSFNDMTGSGYNVNTGAIVEVKGGTFTDDTAKAFATNNLAGGYEVDENGIVAVKPVAEVNGVKYASFAEAVATAQAGDEIKLLANVTVEGTLALPAGIKLTSNGHTINGSIRMLGDLELNGPLTITGGLWVGKSGETLTATLSGDKLTASYFMFQRGTYTINADIDAVYGYLSFEGTFQVNSTIHTTGANGEVLYIRGNVNLNADAVLDSDNSVFLDNDNAVLTLKPGSKVDSNVSITKSGAKLNIDATGMTAGASANITGTVTNSGNGTIAVVGNDKLEAQIVNGKIVLVAKVAKIGENTYRTLAQAVAAVEDGGTITLIANETFTKNNRYNNGGWWDGLGYSGDKTFTIDLANFTISQDGALNDYLMWFKNDGAKANTITLKNGTLDAGTTAYCALATASSNAQKITVNLENITLINNNSNGSTIKVRGGAELNVKGGTKITGKNSYLGIECVASTVNIYEGAEIYMNGTSSYNGCLVGACGGGTVNVYGGYGKGAKGGFIAMTSGGTINVAGGEWIANTNGTVGNNSNVYVLTAQSNKNEQGFVGPAIINVTGGAFRGGMDAWVLNNAPEEKAELNIKGGNFNANPTSYVAEDYIAVENNGVWTVEKAAAKVGEKGYATLEEAFKAAKAGDVVTVFEGTYAMPAMKAGITVVGQGNVMFEGTLTGTLENLTMKNIHIEGGNAQRWAYAKGNLVFENVTFEATSVYALHFDGITAGATLSYKNCTIIGWAAMSGSPANCKFDGCTFNGNGTYGLIRTYFDATIENCTFDVAYVNTEDKYQDGIHAVNGATVTVTNCTNANGDMKEIINIEGTSAVVLDGQVLKNVAKVGDKKFATLDEAIKAADANGEVTLLQDITLTATTDISKAITLDGDNHKLTVSGNGVNALTVSATKDKTVTFKNLEIECTGYGAGSITAGINNIGKNNLVLENVKVLSSNYGIFSSTDNIVVNNSTLKGDMYAIYSSVEADIQLNGSTLEKAKNYGAGSAIYVQKSGSKLDIVKSKITAYAPQANIVAAIEIGDNNVEMNIDKNSTITIEGNNIYVVYVGDKMYNSKKITNGNYNIAAGATINKPNAMLPTIFIKDSNVQLVKDNVAPVMCFTLQDAVNDVAEGQTVQLINNLELSEVATVAKDKSVTLDLNGKTLSTAFVAGSTTNHLYAIHNYGELTITDSSDAKAGKISARGNYNYGKLTLETGTIDACDGNGGYAVKNFADSEFIMNGGAVTASYEDGDTPGNGYDATTVRVESGAKATINGGVINNSSNYTFAIDNAGEVTVNDGTVTSVHSTVSNYGTLTINDGSFTCNGLEGITAHALVAWDGSNTTINGGTFDGKDNYNGFNVCASKGANVVIKGGNFLDVHSGSLYGDGTITVSGGTFFDKISDQRCELGFQAVVNTEGTYDVKRTNKREAYTIVDGKISKYDNSAEIKLGTFTYKRNLLGLDEDGKYKWSPLYLPVQIPVDSLLENYDVAYINDIHSFDNNEDGEIDKMTIEYIKIKTGTLKANYPYVIRPKNEKARTWNLVLTDVVLYPNDENTIKCSSVFETFTIGGTYHTMTGEELAGKLSIKGNGNWENNEASYTLNPLRLHMSIERDGTPVIVDDTKMSIRIAVRGEDDLTDIDAVRNNNETNTLIFDLQGRRVLKPVKGGIYIINGKKVYFE